MRDPKSGARTALTTTEQLLRLIFGGLIFVFCLSAQDSSKRLEYEAASIRPASPDHPNGVGESGGPGTADPTLVRYSFFPLSLLLMTAYDMNVHQIALPDSLHGGDRYDIVAKVPPGTTKQEALVMLQNLLVERFHLKLHRETKVLTHYELNLAPKEPRLEMHRNDAIPSSEPMAPEGVIGIRMAADRNHMRARKVSMKELTRVLSDELATPVVDKTGLAGVYDFDFEYSREGLDGFRRSLTDAPEVSGASTLQIALQESLGLKLASRKGPIEMLVVDSGQRTPEAN
jgi:uncharacterized protein (TIGR03435 family)